MRLVVRDSSKENKAISQPEIISDTEEFKAQYNEILFMETIAKKLELPRRTWGIACVLFHRSLLEFSRREKLGLIHATSCVFLASKVDDNPRDLKLFANLFLQHSNDENRYQENPQLVSEAIIDQEFKILDATGLDFDIELPYPILEEVQPMLHHKDCSLILKKAENFLNECFRSDICLFYPPNVLAAAALYMSARFLRIELQDAFQQKHLLGDSTDVSTKDSITKALPIKIFAFQESIVSTEEVLRKPSLGRGLSDMISQPLLGKRDIVCSTTTDCKGHPEQDCDEFTQSPLKKIRFMVEQKYITEATCQSNSTIADDHREDWWELLGEEVSLDQLVEISTQIYSQLKIVKT